jgi:hypothetical protein
MTTSTELESPLSQDEKRAVMKNDRRVREQTTFKSFADALANEGREGRFKKVESPPKPLPANSPWSGANPGPGDEAPLGFNIDRVER